MMGAKRVIAVDAVPERMALARQSGAEVLDYADGPLQPRILEMTHGEGPDSVIEAVGMESHGTESRMQRVASSVQEKKVAQERPYALDEAIIACRPCGTVSLPGVFVGQVSGVALGPYMNKGLTMKTGQTHMLRYMQPLLRRIEAGEIDPSFIITHRVKLEDGPAAYNSFRDKTDGCIKVVMHPDG